MEEKDHILQLRRELSSREYNYARIDDLSRRISKITQQIDQASAKGMLSNGSGGGSGTSKEHYQSLIDDRAVLESELHMRATENLYIEEKLDRLQPYDRNLIEKVFFYGMTYTRLANKYFQGKRTTAHDYITMLLKQMIDE